MCIFDNMKYSKTTKLVNLACISDTFLWYKEFYDRIKEQDLYNKYSIMGCQRRNHRLSYQPTYIQERNCK